MAADFDTRFREIHSIFYTFHTKFVQDNTKDTYEPSAAIIVKNQIQCIHNTLMQFLNRCLSDGVTCEDMIRDTQVLIIVDNNIVNDESLSTQVKELLSKLCPLMFPWDANIHAKVGHLFNKLSEHPFSPVRLDDAV